jgi:hypothetical protein
MTRRFPSSTVDHSLAIKYLTKASRFKTDAENMAQLSDEFSGNGVAVLCVHAAIAYGAESEAAALLERLRTFSRWADKTFQDIKQRASS